MLSADSTGTGGRFRGIRVQRDDRRGEPFAADVDDPRRITHVTVTADEGFGPGEVAAFNGLKSIILGDAQNGLTLRVQLVG